ncbi:hypothetical protein UA08_02290 [Talaromyces atroroseus]|uniref:Uncharacterized protein n=1 Tax=Talaromyces atroroseus TaxID=1441469 RepID=A0A225B4Z7_TALAT|nr:hypothetical protein UA08_02290 [Talaromyces atroroseus]OKL62336.1 hypothetical protein UA08_02290 [Talaromyces atroroseus]
MESGGPLGKLSQAVTTSIGFASEVRQYNKAKKAASKQRETEQQENSTTPDTTQTPYPSPPREYESASREAFNSVAQTEDERAWQLDDAQDAVVEGSEPRKSKGGVANPDKVIAAFLQRQPPPYSADMATRPVQKLEYPVVIPQRRPKNKKRGFVRAYAPDLQNAGIDQAAWLDFIETLNEASLANPWINAINLASIALQPLPFAISTAISVAVMVATNVAMEAQGRYRQNKALDKLNSEFFRPRGLYCLVMTYDATSTSLRANVDLNTTIQDTMNSQGRASHKFSSSNGITSEFEFMQTAELVYPGLDYLAAAPKEAGFKNKLKRGKLFVDEYMDKRAQAKFVDGNPESLLAQGGKPTFNSKYADPTHPIHSGSLYSLVSMGRYNPSSNNYNMGGGQWQGRSRGIGMGGLNDRLNARLGERMQQQQQLGFGGGGPVGALIGLVGTAAQAVRDRGQNANPPAAYGSSGYSSRSSYQQDRYENNNPPASHGGSEFQPQMQASRAQRGGLGGGPGGLSLKRLLSQKVLYLMVVNMPTEEEMAQARSLAAEWNIQGDQPPPSSDVNYNYP